MGRRRKSGRNLPQRVYLHHGSFRYVAKDGTKTTLARASDYSGMLRALAELLGDYESLDTLRAVLDRYELEVLPGKAASTRTDHRRMLENLRKTFGRMAPKTLRQPHVARYRDARARTAPTAANRELELLSHVCTMAVEWGAMDFHPLKGLRKISRPPRRRYVTDDEYRHIHNLASPMVRCVLDLALLTGLRRGDIFSLTRDNVTDDGLQVSTSKTGAAILFEWTPALRKVITDALKLSPRVRQPIVCNRKGLPYTKNGFDAVWARLMAKATDINKETHIDRFQFRDLRRKSASDETDALVAQARLGHTNVAITNRVYRVRPNRVRPLK